MIRFIVLTAPTLAFWHDASNHWRAPRTSLYAGCDTASSGALAVRFAAPLREDPPVRDGHRGHVRKHRDSMVHPAGGFRFRERRSRRPPSRAGHRTAAAGIINDTQQGHVVRTARASTPSRSLTPGDDGTSVNQPGSRGGSAARRRLAALLRRLELRTGEGGFVWANHLWLAQESCFFKSITSLAAGAPWAS